MRIHSSSTPDAIAHGLLQILVDTLNYEGREIWILSPWLKDVRLPLGQLGDYSALLPQRLDTIHLSELLAVVANQNHLHLITKPPHELVAFNLFKIIERQVQQHADLEDIGFEPGDRLAQSAASIRDTVRDLVAEVMKHETTVRMSCSLPNATVSYLPRLHAKVVWTADSAFVGSANLTNGGIYSNNEIVLEITDEATHAELRKKTIDLVEDALPREQYSISHALKRAGYQDEFEFLDVASSKLLADYPRLLAYADLLSTFAR